MQTLSLRNTVLIAVAGLSLSSAAAVTTACSGADTIGSGNVALPQSSGLVVTPPKQSVFLRASFDDDPGTFVGRFIPDTLAPDQVDENEAVKTRCSEFITMKEVNASGTYDETFHTSTSVGAKLGLAPIAAVGGSAGANSTLRVSYKLQKKLRAEVADTAGLDQCCQAQPDQCAQKYIGEFYLGTGLIYQAAGTQSDFEANGITPDITGDVQFKDEVAWKRVSEFEDVYFAFRTTAARLGSAGAEDGTDCSWAYTVPSSLDGTYFVGISPPSAAQQDAHDAAMQNARLQVVKYLSGEFLQSETKTTSSALEGILDDQRVVTAAAGGVAEYVKDKKWCKPEMNDTPRGAMYTVKVLAFISNEAKKTAAKGALTNISDSLEKDGKLESKMKKRLETLKKQLD